MSNKSIYDADYYERGPITGKSLYENYRWIPELTIPMVMTMIDLLGIKHGDSVLDIGCAKGYAVKAFRWLYRNAYGFDISKYAIRNADLQVKRYLNTKFIDRDYDFAISKDTFEHFEVEELREFLCILSAKQILVIVPIGENDRYNVPLYELDVTHNIRQPLEWWEDIFKSCGWKIIKSTYRIKGIKDNWKDYKKGNGFFVMER